MDILLSTGSLNALDLARLRAFRTTQASSFLNAPYDSGSELTRLSAIVIRRIPSSVCLGSFPTGQLVATVSYETVNVVDLDWPRKFSESELLGGSYERMPVCCVCQSSGDVGTIAAAGPPTLKKSRSAVAWSTRVITRSASSSGSFPPEARIVHFVRNPSRHLARTSAQADVRRAHSRISRTSCSRLDFKVRYLLGVHGYLTLR